MGQSAVKSLWKVPAYCMISGWACFQLEIRFLGQFAVVVGPDKTVTSDSTRWLIISGTLFILVLAVGGLLFFRRMTRRELLCSAAAMTGINVALGLVSYFTQSGWLFWIYSEVLEWCSVLRMLLVKVTDSDWLSAAVLWAAPLLFVLFGRKASEGEP